MTNNDKRTGNGVSRRDVLAAAGISAASGLVLGQSPAAGAATSASATADVVVVGAGLSGLVAARRLVQAGSSVIVLEANDRVGGRTHDLDVAGGVITEGGGQWIGPGQDRIFALLDELGLKSFKTYADGKTIYLRNGTRQTYDGTVPPMGPDALADWAQMQTRLEQMASTIPGARPWEASNAVEWDATTLGAWLDANSLSAEAKWLLTMAFTIIFGEDPHRTALLRALHAIGTSDGLEHMINTTGGAQESRIVGGSQLPSKTMAQQLGNRVILSSPVSQIRQDANGVVVTSARAEVRCKRVIVAMPPSDADHIHFAPDLPVRRAVLQRTWHNGTESKLFAVYDRPFWRDAGLNGQALTDLPITSYVADNSPPDGSVGILVTFMGTAGSGPGQTYSDALLDDPAARRATTLSDLTKLFGPEAGKPTTFLEKDWCHEHWISGCVSSRTPGLITRYTDAVVKPVGRIHWAGTETSTGRYEGYLDGAVRAGERAAREAHSAL